MNLVLAVMVVVVFAGLMERLQIAPRARQATAAAGASVTALRNPELDDAAKEAVLQREALRLFRLFGVIAGLSVIALLVPFAGVVLLDKVGLGSFPAVLGILQRIDFLLAATLVGFGTFAAMRRFGRR